MIFQSFQYSQLHGESTSNMHLNITVIVDIQLQTQVSVPWLYIRHYERGSATKTKTNSINQRRPCKESQSFTHPHHLEESLYGYMPHIHALLSNLLRIELLTNLFNRWLLSRGKCVLCPICQKVSGAWSVEYYPWSFTVFTLPPIPYPGDR